MNKTRKRLIIGILLSVTLVWLVWLNMLGYRYRIVFQKSYSSAAFTNATRGYAVRSVGQVGSILQKYGFSEGAFFKEVGPVNDDTEFVFIVENGTLLEISGGNSGFDLAAVNPSTNLSVAVVHGPKFRPIKTVGRLTAQ